GMERSGHELLARRGDLPRRVRLMPHAERLPAAGATACGPRPRQHRKLYRDAARIQTRLALSPLHAADGGDETGRGRSDRLPQCAGESTGPELAEAAADGAEVRRAGFAELAELGRDQAREQNTAAERRTITR